MSWFRLTVSLGYLQWYIVVLMFGQEEVMALLKSLARRQEDTWKPFICDIVTRI